MSLRVTFSLFARKFWDFFRLLADSNVFVILGAIF